MPRLDKSILMRIYRDIARLPSQVGTHLPSRAGKFLRQVGVWRAVLRHAPQLSAEETVTCVWQILGLAGKPDRARRRAA